jgi:CheY-like chemotaxis protein
LAISVNDTGIGIMENQQKSIFEVFAQQDGQSTKKFGGTGLGLAICKRLSNMMNGEILLQSTVNKGSSFTLALYDVSTSSVSAATSNDKLFVAEFERSTVMIVDDIDTNRFLLIEYLKPYGFDFLEATNGLEAIERLKANNVDVVFMDIRMPVMNGIEATKIIKSDEKLSGTKIIALTASAVETELSKEERKVFDDFLYKPIEIGEILASLMKYISHTKAKADYVESEQNDSFDKESLGALDKYNDSFAELLQSGDLELITRLCDNILADKNIKSKSIIWFVEKLRLSSISFEIESAESILRKLIEL